MGNSHSSHSITCSTKPYTRKRSVLFSRINLGCVASSGSSIHSSEPSIIENAKLVPNEKSLYGDDVDHQKQRLVAYSPTLVNLDESGEAAFQEFIREYPGELSHGSFTGELNTYTDITSIRISIDMDSRYPSSN